MSEGSSGGGLNSVDHNLRHDEAFKGAGPEKVIPVLGRHEKEEVVPFASPLPPELPEVRAIRAAQRTLIVLLALILLSWMRYRRPISYIYAAAPETDAGENTNFFNCVSLIFQLRILFSRKA